MMVNCLVQCRRALQTYVCCNFVTARKLEARLPDASNDRRLIASWPWRHGHANCDQWFIGRVTAKLETCAQWNRERSALGQANYLRVVTLLRPHLACS